MPKQTVRRFVVGFVLSLMGCSLPTEGVQTQSGVNVDMEVDASPLFDSEIKESATEYGKYERTFLGGEVVVYTMERSQLHDITITSLSESDRIITVDGTRYQTLSAYNLLPSPKNFEPPILLKVSLDPLVDESPSLTWLSRASEQSAWRVHEVNEADSEVVRLEDQTAALVEVAHFSDGALVALETEEAETCEEKDPKSYCPPGGLLAPLENWEQTQTFTAHPSCDGADFVNGDSSAELLAPAPCVITTIVSDYNERCSSTGTYPECADCFFFNCSAADYSACVIKGCTEYGNHLKCELETNADQQILMAHARSLTPGLTQGATLERGDTVGVIGNTGHVIAASGGDGTHLHMGLSEKRSFVGSLDPVPCFLIDVEVTKPSPNSTITLGQGFDVDWEFSEVPRQLTISAIESGDECYGFSGTAVAIIDSPSVSGRKRVVIDDLDLSKSIQNYKGLKVAAMNSNGHWSCSQVPISIVEEDMPPDPVEPTAFSIGVTSPSANSIIKLGETFTLGWSASEAPRNIIVELIKSDSGCLGETGINLKEITSPAKEGQFIIAISGPHFLSSQDVPSDYKALKIAAQNNAGTWVCDLVPIVLEDDWPNNFYNSVGNTPPSGPLQGEIQYGGDEDVLSLRIGGGFPRDVCVFTTGSVDLECTMIRDNRDEGGSVPPIHPPEPVEDKGTGPCAMEVNTGPGNLVQVKIKGLNGATGAYSLNSESLSTSTHCSP